MLEPGMIVPQVLERAYSGLEVVNETHRTTAVLSMLVGIAQPLVSEKIWLGGQRHIVPLLDLCLPGIDLVWYFANIHENTNLKELLRMIPQRLYAQLLSFALLLSTSKSVSCDLNQSNHWLPSMFQWRVYRWRLTGKNTMHLARTATQL